jgi:CheY-like chemotaxis protein
VRALVVDDQASVRVLLSHVLRTEVGCSVNEATDGAEALALLGRQSYDLVLLDLMMPCMDGLETLELMRRNPELRHVPVVVLSAVRDEAKVRQLVRHGIAAYLAKPLRPLDVAARLRDITSRLPATAGKSSLLAHELLRPHLVAATEQVFGMMLGIEVAALESAPAPATEDGIVAVAVALAGQRQALELSVGVPRATAERMTARAIAAGDVVTDAHVAATLGEIVSIIGSRLQTTLRQCGEDVSLGQPQVRDAERSDEQCAAWLRVGFTLPAQHVRFTATLRRIPAPAASFAAGHGRHGPPSPHPVLETVMYPPVDPDVLEMLASLQEPGEPDLVAELIGLFLGDTPERLHELHGGPLDPTHVVRVAHAVKGSAGNIGAMHLQEVAGDLEQAGHQCRPPSELARLVAAVDVEYERVRRHLEAELAARRPVEVPHNRS